MTLKDFKQNRKTSDVVMIALKLIELLQLCHVSINICAALDFVTFIIPRNNNIDITFK